MVELWKANPEGWIDRYELTDKEMAATRKGKPIRGNYLALSLNKNYGYHEDYDAAVNDMWVQMESRIARSKMHMKVLAAAVRKDKKAYKEAIEAYGR